MLLSSIPQGGPHITHPHTLTHTQAGTYLIHQAMATGFSLFYLLAHSRNWFPQYRIQPDPSVDVPLLKARGGGVGVLCWLIYMPWKERHGTESRPGHAFL